MEHPGTEEEMEKAFLDLVKRLPPEIRLAGMTLEQRLQGLSPEQRREALSPEALIAGLSPEELENLRQLVQHLTQKQPPSPSA